MDVKPYVLFTSAKLTPSFGQGVQFMASGPKFDGIAAIIRPNNGQIAEDEV